MKQLLMVLLGFALPSALAISGWRGPTASAQANAQAPSESAPNARPSGPANRGNDQENARQSRALLDQAIQALGGQTYLNIHDVQQEGRAFSFYHGRPSGTGALFWRFVEYPDKERLEVTKERDVAYVYTGNKGYEVTYKGPHAVEKKDLDDYLRHRRLSLETILRTWVNDPSVALFYEGNALAGNALAQQLTLINAKDEAVQLFLDADTHLPLKKSYTWRDPVDKERNVEEEVFDNYKPVQGVMTYYSFTRYYNGDMQSQRFINSIQFNQGLNPAMFDPNSGYNPNKAAKKH
ncbi:MAG: hypothetical protein WCA20_28760 [Candidatus Sulfotelmatobacter sp.]